MNTRVNGVRGQMQKSSKAGYNDSKIRNTRKEREWWREYKWEIKRESSVQGTVFEVRTMSRIWVTIFCAILDCASLLRLVSFTVIAIRSNVFGWLIEMLSRISTEGKKPCLRNRESTGSTNWLSAWFGSMVLLCTTSFLTNATIRLRSCHAQKANQPTYQDQPRRAYAACIHVRRKIFPASLKFPCFYLYTIVRQA